MLCHPCEHVLGEIQKNPDGGGTFPHHASIGDWEKAVEQKCLLCRRLHHNESHVGAHTSFKLIARTPTKGDKPGIGVISFAISTDTEDFPEVYGQFWLRPIKTEEGW